MHVKLKTFTDMKKNLDEYDTSNYSPGHPLFSTANKKIIGKFKDELGGKVMTEFIGIRPKMYSYVGEESGKRAKGVKKSRTPEKPSRMKTIRNVCWRRSVTHVTCPVFVVTIMLLKVRLYIK